MGTNREWDIWENKWTGKNRGKRSPTTAKSVQIPHVRKDYRGLKEVNRVQNSPWRGELCKTR